VDADALRRELEGAIEGEVRFDLVSRALYSTDASVYQIQPLGPARISFARSKSAAAFAVRSRCAEAAPRRPGKPSAKVCRSTPRNITTGCWR